MASKSFSAFPRPTGVTRRDFLRVGGMGLLAGACAPGTLAPAISARPPQVYSGPADSPLLVTIFLRGGADGLHLVPPTGERHYASVRGQLALKETLPLARGFGLHPSLEPLVPLVERGELAVVHAVGSTDASRSHFEAQDLMEAGTPDTSRITDGWLARALRDEASESPFASLALTGALPLTLRGSGGFAMDDPARFGLPFASAAARDVLAERYASWAEDPVGDAGVEALSALATFEARMGRSRAGQRGRRGRSGRRGLGAAVEGLLALDAGGIHVRAVFLESASWDTHINQGATSGSAARLAGDLASAMARLDAAFRGRRDLLVVVMTEFGRTVRPNGSGGTDHGHGSVMFVAGPRVRGGLYADWRGLESGALYEERDLPVTTDYRSVLTEVLAAHRGAPPPADTFPDFAPRPLGLVA